MMHIYIFESEIASSWFIWSWLVYTYVFEREKKKKRLKTEAEQTNNFNPFDAFYRSYYVKIFIHYELKLKVQ